MANRRLLFVQTQTKSSKEINRPVIGMKEHTFRQLLKLKNHASMTEEVVLDRVRTTLAECENGEFMSVDIEK